MYPNYPHENYEQHFDIAMRAVEGDVYHLLMQSDVITLSLTANTPYSQNVTFSRPYTPNTTPHVYVGVSSIGDIHSTIKNLVGSSPTNTGFTIQCLSDTTQNITVTWIAKGKAE